MASSATASVRENIIPRSPGPARLYVHFRKEQQDLPNALSANGIRTPSTEQPIEFLWRQSSKSVAFSLATDPTAISDP